MEFDGQNDSIYHPFDLDGNKHMDYLNFRGEYDDVPLAEIQQSFNEILAGTAFLDDNADFNSDVEKEVTAAVE